LVGAQCRSHRRSAGTVFLGGVATCYFGVDHEIVKIPPEIRARMTNTDWVGTEWVLLGMVISAGGICILVIAFAFRAWVRSRAVAAERQ
jgi:hypothetical protein